LEEDVKPSSTFSLKFLKVIQKHYLDLSNVKEFITRLVLPVLLCPTEEIEQVEGLRQLQICINAYFASLVPKFQERILCLLSDLLDLLHVQVRKFVLLAFFVPASRSKYSPKKTLGITVLQQYKHEL